MHNPYAVERSEDDEVLDDVPEAGLAETGEYRVRHWDDTVEVVTAYMCDGGEVVMVYHDGITHRVRDSHFWSMNPVRV